MVRKKLEINNGIDKGKKSTHNFRKNKTKRLICPNGSAILLQVLRIHLLLQASVYNSKSRVKSVTIMMYNLSHSPVGPKKLSIEHSVTKQ